MRRRRQGLGLAAARKVMRRRAEIAGVRAWKKGQKRVGKKKPWRWSSGH